MTDLDRVTQNDLIDWGVKVRDSAPDADALLVSCGGFRTLEIIAPLEARVGVPGDFEHAARAVGRREAGGVIRRSARLRQVVVRPASPLRHAA